MRIQFTIVFVGLLLGTSNGCEEHRRQRERGLAEARRAQAERLREYERAALERQQRKAYEDVRQSLYGGESYSDPIRTIPAGSKFCPGQSTYFCENEATCVITEDGSWGCRQELVAQISEVPTVTRLGGYRDRRPSSRYTQRRYYPSSPSYSPYANSYIPRYRTYTCGAGFDRINLTSTTFKCVDIDECSTEVNQCEHTCKNTRGSFYCTCENGYKREGATQCVDRDECVDFQNICSERANCINNEGSYDCECREGYRPDEENPRLCYEINECQEDDPCEIDEICFNTWGSFECYEPVECPPGYVESNVTNGSSQDCKRNTSVATDDPNSPDLISYKRIAAEAKKRWGSSGRLASLTFTGGNNNYNHYFSVKVLEGGEHFWYRRRGYALLGSNNLNLDIFNRRPLKAGDVLPYSLLITDKMYPKVRTTQNYFVRDEYGNYRAYSNYGASPVGRTSVTTKRKLVMEIIPMTHGQTEED